MNKQALFEAFGKLGWKFQYRGISYWDLYTPEGENTNLQFSMEDKGQAYSIRQDYGIFRGGANFILKNCFFEWLGDDTITLRVKKNPYVFINFHDFKDKKSLS